MALWAYDPFDDLRRMQRSMDKIFSDSFSSENQLEPTEKAWSPACDVREGEKDITIHVELPGVKKEDMKVELRDGILTISGKKSYEKKEENEKYRRIERSFGSFSRSMAVPKSLKDNQIKANFQNGVLEIAFPKIKESESKPIPISDK